MKNMKKLLAILLTGCTTFSLAACGSGAVQSAPEEGAAAGEENAAEEGSGQEASGEKVHIKVQSWQYALGDYKGFSSDDELTQAIADEFNATHDDIEVEVVIMRQEDHYNSLKVDFAAGSAPDVIGIAPGADLNQYKSQLEPLAPYAEAEWGSAWADQFTDAAFSTIRLSGDEIYAFPSAMSASGTIWYNQSLMEQGGVNTFPATWDELKTAADSLRAAGEIPLMFGGKDDWQNYDMFITIMGTVNKELCNDIFAAAGDWTDADVVKAFEYYQKLYTDGIVQDGALATSMYNEGYSQWRDDNGNSTLPMVFNGSWDLGSLKSTNSYYEQFSSYGINAATFPAIEGNTGVVLSAPDVAWGVNAASANKAAAWEFVRWLCYDMQQDVVDGLGFFSVLKESPAPTVELPKDYKAAYDIISSAAASENAIGFRSSFYADLNAALYDQLQLLSTGDTAPADAAAAMAAASAAISK